jgi:hypothetical protein
MLRCVNDGVTTIEPGHQKTGNARVFQALPYVRKRLRLEITQRSLQTGMSRSNSETRGGSVMVWAVITLLPFLAKLLQGSTWKGWLMWCIT